MNDWTTVFLNAPPIAVVLAKITAVLAITWILHGLLHPANPRWRVLLWRFVMIALVALPTAECILPRLEIAVPREASLPDPIPFIDDFHLAAPTTSTEIVAPHTPIATVPSVAESHASRPAPQPTITWPRVFVLIWCAVTLLLLLRVVQGWTTVQRIFARSAPMPASIEALAESIRVTLGVKRDIRFLIAEHVDSAFVAGILRPTIVLPERCACDNDVSQLTAILAHELAHVKNNDPAWLLLGRLAHSIFWFHPLMWRVNTAHAAASEDVCDAVAATHIGNAATYARALAREAVASANRRLAVVAVPMVRSAQILRRLRAIQRGVTASPLTRRHVAAILTVGTLLLALVGCLSVVQASLADSVAESGGGVVGARETMAAYEAAVAPMAHSTLHAASASFHSHNGEEIADRRNHVFVAHRDGEKWDVSVLSRELRADGTTGALLSGRRSILNGWYITYEDYPGWDPIQPRLILNSATRTPHVRALLHMAQALDGYFNDDRLSVFDILRICSPKIGPVDVLVSYK